MRRSTPPRRSRSSTRIGVRGLGMYVPPKVLTNVDLEKMVDTNDEWIRTRTGICERRVAEPGTASSDLAYKAAQEALTQAELDPKDVELLIVATTTPDMLFPSTSCLVQERLGASSAVCFDLSAACSGSIFAIITAQQYLLTGRYRNALVVGAEVLSSFIDWTDRSTCVLFGDGAGACVLAPVRRGGILATDMGSDGSAAQLLYMPGGGSKHPPSHASVDQRLHFLRMNGTEIFKLAVRRMANSAKRVVKAAKLDPREVDCFIPHQANTRIIEAVAKWADLPMEKVYMNLQRYGNTSAASNLIALYEAVRDGVIQRDDHVVMVAFGAGLTWGSLLLQW
ncbi:MAG: beta-ketoacyl-ACP synthase III [Candidatus Omnitrophota bacterium]|nr:beta-ketoacyl-ACP synthase III [Candidatus Omnitrophota bacterium]